MTQYNKPKTDRPMFALERLRSVSATEQEASDQAKLLYPGIDETSKSNRSLFMRIFRAQEKDFQCALRQWKIEGFNFGKIAKLIPGRRPGGAPKGNLFAAKHRATFALPRCQSSWNGLTPEEKLLFLRDNGLIYAPN